MYRAIIFDFYSVWGPDRLSTYTQQLAAIDQAAGETFTAQVASYYAGMSEIQELIDSLSFKFRTLGQTIDPADLLLPQSAIAPQAIQFIQSLHGHFLKVGIVANLGRQERSILENLQQQLDLFDTITSVDSPDETLLSQVVFARGLYAIGEPPESCLAISGHDEYLQFASTMGLATMRFEGFPKLIQDINQVL